ncbi:MAG: hypothetical protein U0360_10395 [Dehalococcoidia bacterium]
MVDDQPARRWPFTLGDDRADARNRELATVVAEDEQVSRTRPQRESELGGHQLPRSTLHLGEVGRIWALARITTAEHARGLFRHPETLRWSGAGLDFLQLHGAKSEGDEPTRGTGLELAASQRLEAANST